MEGLCPTAQTHFSGHHKSHHDDNEEDGRKNTTTLMGMALGTNRNSNHTQSSLSSTSSHHHQPSQQQQQQQHQQRQLHDDDEMMLSEEDMLMIPLMSTTTTTVDAAATATATATATRNNQKSEETQMIQHAALKSTAGATTTTNTTISSGASVDSGSISIRSRSNKKTRSAVTSNHDHNNNNHHASAEKKHKRKRQNKANHHHGNASTTPVFTSSSNTIPGTTNSINNINNNNPSNIAPSKALNITTTTTTSNTSSTTNSPATALVLRRRRQCCPAPFVRSTLSVMNFLARLLFWGSVVAMVAAVVWYSYELKNNGTDPHLIAWFSAGAFVLLGFPISMYGIVMHLANYNQPNVQMYIVRILWMVPIYSMESWLCLRFHSYAIYIETLRDVYESYVLYSFLQFLIQVLGGEEELILMLKDKSPTRGVHMWGLQWCVKPWLMGQPKTVIYAPATNTVNTCNITNNNNSGNGSTPNSALNTNANTNTNAATSSLSSTVPTSTTATTTNSSALPTPISIKNNPLMVAAVTTTSPNGRPLKKVVQWTSPFYVRCKLGVLQYVLFKLFASIFVFILELHDLYKEGDFTPRGGYLYICILTNLSQCWALYCLIFFYFATVNELSPIRPVGKFLSVKAIVFFTWWQSVVISLTYQMNLIPHYHAVSNESEWTSEDVAKGLQDYLICIEMFLGSIVHVFVFPHTDYLPQAVQARRQYNNSGTANAAAVGKDGQYHQRRVRQLGRKKYYRPYANHLYIMSDDVSAASKNSGDVEMQSSSSSISSLHPPPYYYNNSNNNQNYHARYMGGSGNTNDDYQYLYPRSQQPFQQYKAGAGGTPPRNQHFDFTSTSFNHRPTTNTTMPMMVVEQQQRSSIMEPTDQEHGQDDNAIDDDDEDDDDDEEDEDDDDNDDVLDQYNGQYNNNINNTMDFQHHSSLLPFSSNNNMPPPPIQLSSIPQPRTGFVKALIESTIPRDVIDSSVGIVKGEYNVEKKTLLAHAATSDSYDLFSSSRRFLSKTAKQLEGKD